MNISEIKLRRLKDVPIKGNFSINCQEHSQFLQLQQFFLTSNNYIKFKDFVKISGYKNQFHSSYPYISLFISGDKRTKFFIKYENLNQLLKLREIFNVRANKFDMELIEKRKYNPFTIDFFKKCADPIIYTVKK